MAESGTHGHESGERLVVMANDIGNYFKPQSREEAIAGIANHIQRFWTPHMRKKLNAYVAEGNSGLDELPLAALARLNEQSASSPKQPSQGTAP
jgi:formate dehydrogenase subunit delta